MVVYGHIHGEWESRSSWDHDRTDLASRSTIDITKVLPVWNHAATSCSIHIDLVPSHLASVQLAPGNRLIRTINIRRMTTYHKRTGILAHATSVALVQRQNTSPSALLPPQHH